jgi:hypothetical protein
LSAATIRSKSCTGFTFGTYTSVLQGVLPGPGRHRCSFVTKEPVGWTSVQQWGDTSTVCQMMPAMTRSLVVARKKTTYLTATARSWTAFGKRRGGGQ